MYLAPPASTRSSPAMGHPRTLLLIILICTIVQVLEPVQPKIIKIWNFVSCSRPQDGAGEFRDRLERRHCGFPMRRMSDPRQHRHVDLAIARLLRDLDLADGEIG